ncbi:MAG: hypothetical protein ACKVJU_14190 [Verrucomicrobiales bacterium]
MKSFLQFLLIFGLIIPAFADEPIDFGKAKAIFARRKAGEEITAAEEAYVKRAIAEQQRRKQSGERPRVNSNQKPWTGHFIPMTELGSEKYKGEDGGLYGGGSNEPPAVQLDAAMKASGEIQHLDADGKPFPDGKIGLFSVGMSNTTMEYSKFKQLADADPEKSPKVVIVDGAQGGQTALRWADPEAPLWKTVDARVKAAGLSDQQIQVAWMKQAEARPAQYGEFPDHVKQLQANLVKDLINLKAKFPNLKIVYLSSRIYGGYATTSLNPEPYAYEEAFAMRWLIADQIAGKAEMKNLPVLLWGPYLWADGETPRKADGLTYTRTDLSEKDGTHPAETGRAKVATLLLDFMKTDATAKLWFAK